ncbi:hypothetical protein RHMOL_Rhmol06G0004200 [Rhododendron molle]|uniref:Uncharacterized protein n=1 Tax=Rhododendron molle TaxID=49168 RepID=A0ACC0N7J5_RHOML|nr:hypothetical protein RHMOL_Rhmol06G0004200 [Rhododendron molle]
MVEVQVDEEDDGDDYDVDSDSSDEDEVFHDSEYGLTDDDEMFDKNIDRDVKFVGLQSIVRLDDHYAAIVEEMIVLEGGLDDSSDERISFSASSDEEGGYRKKGRKYIVFNEKTDMANPRFMADMEFETHEVLRDAIKEHSVKMGKMVKFKKCDRQKVKAVCQTGCPWEIYGSYIPNEALFRVKKYKSVHECWATWWDSLDCCCIDADNCIYPFAYVVVEKEKFKTWNWFLELLIKDLNIQNFGSHTIMSDKQKGLIQVNNVSPMAPAQASAESTMAPAQASTETTRNVTAIANVAVNDGGETEQGDAAKVGARSRKKIIANVGVGTEQRNTTRRPKLNVKKAVKIIPNVDQSEGGSVVIN